MASRIPLQFVTDTMRLAKPVTDTDGRVLAGMGTRLTDGIARLLRNQAILTVMVEDDSVATGWESLKPLPEELAALDSRFAEAERTAAMDALRDAVARHLTRRSARFAGGEDESA